jgi:hypothetical protein
MNAELPDDVLLPGGEVLPVPLVTTDPFDFLGFVLQMQIKTYEAMMIPQEYWQAWRILWEPLLPTGSDRLERD